MIDRVAVWERGGIVKIVVGDQSLELNRNEVPTLIGELTAFEKQGRWRAAEVKELVRLWEEGKPSREIARLLGRTGQSVSNKLWKLKHDGALDC